MNSHSRTRNSLDIFLPKRKKNYFIASVIFLAVAAFFYGSSSIALVNEEGKSPQYWIPGIKDFLEEHEFLDSMLTYLGPVLVALAALIAIFTLGHVMHTRTGNYRWLRWPVFALSFVGAVAGFPKCSVEFIGLSLIGGVLFLHSAGQIPDKAATPHVHTPHPEPESSFPTSYSQSFAQTNHGTQQGLSPNFQSWNANTASYGASNTEAWNANTASYDASNTQTCNSKTVSFGHRRTGHVVTGRAESKDLPQ